MDLVGEFGAEL